MRNTRLLILAATIVGWRSRRVFFTGTSIWDPQKSRLPALARIAWLQTGGAHGAKRRRSASAYQSAIGSKNRYMHDVDPTAADVLEKDGISGLAAFTQTRIILSRRYFQQSSDDARYRPQLFREISWGGPTATSFSSPTSFDYGALPRRKSNIHRCRLEILPKVRNVYKVRYFVPLRSDTEELHRLFKSLECLGRLKLRGSVERWQNNRASLTHSPSLSPELPPSRLR